MSHYRRSQAAGATYFFTLVAYRRQPILCDAPIREALHDAIVSIRDKRPFTIDAWVFLPDHLQCLWTLPPDDADFSTRWGLIKRQVSINCKKTYQRPEWLTISKLKHRESTIWQRRFWEHQIRDETDFIRHMDYIHYNPVKHRHCNQLSDWPYSTFHRYVNQGVYPSGWTGNAIDLDVVVGE